MPNEIVLPYRPREFFKPLHASPKRWIVAVCHRRAGKTVALVNHLIRAALMNRREFPPPRYAYVAPSFQQGKDLVWGYLHQFTATLPGVKFLETELAMILPNGARISIYGGAQAFERIRGLYLDGAVLDEYALLSPECFDVVVRPALADYGGFAVICGTAAGRDHLYEAFERAKKNPDSWDVFHIPITATNVLPIDEIDEMRQVMTPNQFAREMLCSFDAPVEGSYYGDLIVDLQRKGRICKVPYDSRGGVVTSWDIGMSDNTSIWCAQRIGRELHIIDFISGSGKGLDYYVKQLQLRGYNYVGHILPHDIKVRELGTGRSRYEVLGQLGLDVTICPDHKIDDGVAGVRSLLPDCWIDEDRCAEGLISLKAYQSAPAVNLGTQHARPLHNWASHAADSFRYMAMGLDLVLGWNSSQSAWGEKFKKWRVPNLLAR